MPLIDDPNIPNPPPKTTATSPDGILTATALAYGVYLEADFPADPIIDYVRFVQLPNIGVRSGTDAVAVGGQAEAFDSELPLGGTARWTASAIKDDKIITTSDEVTLATNDIPEVAAESCRVTCINVPSLSRALIGTLLPEMTRAGRSNLSNVAGSSYPAGPWDKTIARTTELEVDTRGLGDDQQLEELFTSGPVLVQFASEYRIRDMYAIPGTVTIKPQKHKIGSHVLWSVELTEIARPTPIDAALSIPGRTYADLEGYTYEQIEAIFPTYADMSRPA